MNASKALARGCIAQARPSSVLIEINGRSSPMQIPFATETPTLKPVYDPGPEETTTAESSAFSFPRSRNKESTIGMMARECNFSW